MADDVVIGDRVLGDDHPCFIIAEAGSNHDGDFDQATRLIEIASEAGADAVKFQAYSSDRIAARTEHEIASIDFGGHRHLHELYASTELPVEWLHELKRYAEARGLVFLCTPFDEEMVDVLEKLDLTAYKVASFELVHHPLLAHIAKKGKPVLLSTGLANLGEIEETLGVLEDAGPVPVVLLHCGINYPLAFEDVNLRAMETLRAAFRVPVGYSDHTLGSAVPTAAVTMGCAVIEKHYTVSRGLDGPDHTFALEPEELKGMVDSIRSVEAALGSPRKGPTEGERVHLSRGRRSLFAAVHIPEGTIIAPDMVRVLRPGVGLAPKYLDVVIGRRAARDIEAHEPIAWDAI